MYRQLQILTNHPGCTEPVVTACAQDGNPRVCIGLQSWDPTTRLTSLGGVFAQRGHSARYHGVNVESTLENHPPTEACMINSEL